MCTIFSFDIYVSTSNNTTMHLMMGGIVIIMTGWVIIIIFYIEPYSTWMALRCFTFKA